MSSTIIRGFYNEFYDESDVSITVPATVDLKTGIVSYVVGDEWDFLPDSVHTEESYSTFDFVIEKPNNIVCYEYKLKKINDGSVNEIYKINLNELLDAGIINSDYELKYSNSVFNSLCISDEETLNQINLLMKASEKSYSSNINEVIDITNNFIKMKNIPLQSWDELNFELEAILSDKKDDVGNIKSVRNLSTVLKIALVLISQFDN